MGTAGSRRGSNLDPRGPRFEAFWPSGGPLVAAAGRSSEKRCAWTREGVRGRILSGFRPLTSSSSPIFPSAFAGSRRVWFAPRGPPFQTPGPAERARGAKSVTKVGSRAFRDLQGHRPPIAHLSPIGAWVPHPAQERAVSLSGAYRRSIGDASPIPGRCIAVPSAMHPPELAPPLRKKAIGLGGGGWEDNRNEQ